MLSVPVLEIWKTPLVTFVTLQASASGAVALVVAETGEGALAVAETAETDTERPRRAAQRIFMVLQHDCSRRFAQYTAWSGM
jgi:hypothetical protein